MIHRWARAEHLATARIVVFGIWFALVATTPVTQYTRLPPEFVEPHGVMRFLPVEAVLASAPALTWLKAATLVACALCMLGVRPWRPIAIVAVLLVLGHDGAMKSIQGFVNHGQMAALYTAMVLAVSPAADALSVHRAKAERSEWRYGGPLLACAFVIALAYTLMGVRRLVWGGWEVFTDGSIVRWVVARSLEYAAYDFDLGLLALEWRYAGVVLALGMLGVTVLEALSLLTLRRPRFRLIWLLGLVPFHVSTLFLMNILFWENLLLIAVFFTTLGYGTDRPTPERERAHHAAVVA